MFDSVCICSQNVFFVMLQFAMLSLAAWDGLWTGLWTDRTATSSPAGSTAGLALPFTGILWLGIFSGCGQRSKTASVA